MKKIKKPKIVFIDWSGTLSRSKFWGHLEKTNTNLFTRIENNLFKKNIGLIKPWMKADTSSEDVVKQISEEIQIDYDLVLKEFIVGCEHMEFVSPKVPRLIKRIQSNRIKVYIASNNMDSFDRWTAPYMNLHGLFDGIVNSFGLKALKHDFDNDRSMFFDSVLRREGVLPKETILIDDSEDKEDLLSTYGIDYRRISETNTLIDELRAILHN